MKTRYKVLPIIVIGIISVFAINNGHDLFHYMNLPYEWHDSFGFTDTNIVRSTQCASEELAWLEPCIDVKMVSDNTPEQLEAILEHCIDSKDLVDTVGLSYDNGTHRIDTVSCKWADIAQIPIDPTFEMNRNDLSQVLDWCNDISEVKYGFYNYSNETHSIDTSTCEWKQHEPYPTGVSLCIPYVEKWVSDEDWSNGTHYFDAHSCTWKMDPEFDSLNSKGCPQFCPKEKSEIIDDFDETFGGLENRHPAFWGYDIPKVCTEDMIKHLMRYSSMFEKNTPYSLEWISMDESIDSDDFDRCVEELLERNPKELENEN